MDKVIKRIEIDVYNPTFYEVIKAQQGDDNSRFVEFILYNQGDPYTVSGNIVAKLEGCRADKSPVIKDCNIKDNIVTVELDSDLLYYPGILHLKIVLYDTSDNSILSTIPFTISNQKNPLNKPAIEKDNYSLIDELILRTETTIGALNNHIADNVCHITSEEREQWNDAVSKKHTHSNKTILDGTTASYTIEEQNKLLNIENGAEINIQSDWNEIDSTNDAYIKNKPSVYTKNEVDNKFSTLETNIDWKESVDAYDDITITYPLPQDGWTVNVKDTDYTYRYNGSEWVAISANAIPKATQSVDGLLSKEDKINYDAAKTHADSIHARTDATKTEWSSINGNIKINDTETNVYTHPDSEATFGSYGDNTNQTPNAGDTFKVPYVSIDEQGHVTEISEHTVKMPAISIVVDDTMSNTSENPVQNKVVNEVKLDKTGDVQDNTVTFQSDDDVEVFGTTDVGTGEILDKKYTPIDKTWHEMEPIGNKENLGTVFGKISTLFHNVRYLYKMLGNTDISSIGDGTVTDSIHTLNENFLNRTYPVGSIYMSVNNVNPSDLFGGTWTRWSAGRCIVGVYETDEDFNEPEKAGGEKTHKLNVNEMPSHSHPQTVMASTNGFISGRADYAGDYTDLNNYPQGINTQEVGGDLAHNNMQPYITCYIWKRIS